MAGRHPTLRTDLPRRVLAGLVAMVLASLGPRTARADDPTDLRPAQVAARSERGAARDLSLEPPDELELDLRLEGATRKIRAGGVLLALGVLSFAASIAAAYVRRGSPCDAAQHPRCIEFGPGMSVTAAALMTAPVLVAGGITLGIGVGQRRALLGEVDYGFARRARALQLTVRF